MRLLSGKKCKPLHTLGGTSLMKNILIRSGMSPFDSFTPEHIMTNNSIGGNVGNLIYAYSVYRTLTKEDTVITPDYYKIDHTKADEINETYDCYIIPLADAFREDFRPSLRKYTKLIKKLHIPVIVVGVGLRAPFEPKLNEGFPFDEDVKAFVHAVLEKSAIIGLRGEITSRYLTSLGFREGIDHTVIGCPSMYAFGRNLHIRDTNITKDSKVAINNSKLSPKNVLDFMERSTNEYPNHYFIPQWVSELRLTHLGSPNLKNPKDNYPCAITDDIYQNNRVRFFLNAPTWIEFMRSVDLAFGLRLHGNITATIAGTPSILIPKDARMRELAEYHTLTSVWANSITDETNIKDLVEQADFHRPETSQPKNFDHFVDFLNQNGIRHIYEDNKSIEDAPLDQMLSSVNHLPPTTPIYGCSQLEVAKRWHAFQVAKHKKSNHTKKKLENKYKQEIAQKNKRMKWLEGTINRKSVRLALKTANLFRLKK